ncbi:hypothetical protein PR048_015666 [Dryococelus australis]|uniref:DDE Tnp4 domain-containing protein n=1 Tax=Dryococelus australis TaxID=614101 RepID=A0ABQ9HHK1_9NEOP|nr:hypothetical protein PR048_015666 [Dryococelus australis]
MGLYPYRRLQYNKAAKDFKVGQGDSPITYMKGLSFSRFLAECSSYHQLAYEFFRGVSTFAQISPETCEAIWSAPQPHLMPVPDEGQWKGIARRYYELWNVPNCIGSVDGKHIRIRSYDHSGSNNFNCLHYFSTVLMASADADALFVTIDLGRWLATDSLNISAPALLPGDEKGTPFQYYFCGDEAFPLRDNVMRPYSRRILNNTRSNYRSRCVVVVLPLLVALCVYAAEINHYECDRSGWNPLWFPGGLACYGSTLLRRGDEQAPAHVALFSTFEVKRRRGDKCDSASRFKYAIAPKRKSLGWCAVFQLHCVYLWNYQM